MSKIRDFRGQQDTGRIIVLGSPIQPVPSLGFTGLVSAIPLTFLTLGGPSRTEVQVRDSSSELVNVLVGDEHLPQWLVLP